MKRLERKKSEQLNDAFKVGWDTRLRKEKRIVPGESERFPPLVINLVYFRPPFSVRRKRNACFEEMHCTKQKNWAQVDYFQRNSFFRSGFPGACKMRTCSKNSSITLLASPLSTPISSFSSSSVRALKKAQKIGLRRHNVR